MKRLLASLICLVIMLGLCACKSENENTRFAEGSVVITAENLPKIAVTEINEKIALNLTVAILGCEKEQAYTLITVCETPDECYTLLANGECDLVIAHEPSKAAEATLKEKGVDTEASVIAKDALVFTVNEQNSATDFTVEQLTSIYSPEVNNWNQLGLFDGEIAKFKPNLNSAAAKAFEKFFEVDLLAVNVPKKSIITEDGELFAELPYDNGQNSITFALYSDLQRPSTDRFGPRKYLSVAGVLPDAHNIQAGTYPLGFDILLTFKADESDDSIAKLYKDWILSEQGMKIIGGSGVILPLAE